MECRGSLLYSQEPAWSPVWHFETCWFFMVRSC